MLTKYALKQSVAVVGRVSRSIAVGARSPNSIVREIIAAAFHKGEQECAT